MIARDLLDHNEDRAQWNNEEGTLVAVKRNDHRIPHDPTLAIFVGSDGLPISISLYQEDRRAFERGGYIVTSADEFTPRNPTVRLEYMNGDLRLRQIQHADMVSWLDIRRAGEPRKTDSPAAEVIHMVSSPIEVDDAPGNVVSGPFASQRQPVRITDEQPPSASLYMKMARVMASLTTIPKNGYNKFQDYKFVTAGDLYAAVRTAMAAQGIALMVRYLGSRQEAQSFTDNYGKSKSQTMTYVNLEFVLACGDSGATVVIPWIGTTTTTHDKSIAGAITNAEKAFLQSTFIVSTEDPSEDPDNDASRDTEQAAAPKRQNKQQAAPAQQSKPGASPQRKNLNSYFVGEFHYGDFYAAIKDDFNHANHRDNALVEMVVEGKLKPNMTVAEAVAAVKVRKGQPEVEAQS